MKPGGALDGIPRRTRLALFLVAFASVSALGFHRFGTIDAMQRLALTRSWLLRGSLVADPYGPVKYGPLQPLLAMPSYGLGYAAATLLPGPTDPHRVGYRFTAFLFTPMVVAATLLVFVRLATRLGAAPRDALPSAGLLLFGTFLLPYSRLLFSEPLYGLLFLLALEALVPASNGEKPALLTLPFLLSLLSLANPVFLPLLPAGAGLLVFRLVRDGRRSEARHAALAALLCGVATAAAWALYNLGRYGRPLEFGYAGESFGTPLLTGLRGLIFSIGRGLAVYSPLTFLAALSIPFLLRLPAPPSRRLVLGAALGAWLTYLVVYARWDSFEGGWCWGPRFLLPFVPALHLAVPFLLARARGAGLARRGALGVVVLAALCVNAWEYLGVYQEWERSTFLSGAVDYKRSVFEPAFAAILHGWSADAALRRLPTFLAASVLCLAPLAWLARRAARGYSGGPLGEGSGEARRPAAQSAAGASPGQVR